jgi:NADH:ubiquinone oxidoreductase subunit 3 (subunit A)
LLVQALIFVAVFKSAHNLTLNRTTQKNAWPIERVSVENAYFLSSSISFRHSSATFSVSFLPFHPSFIIFDYDSLLLFSCSLARAIYQPRLNKQEKRYPKSCAKHESKVERGKNWQTQSAAKRAIITGNLRTLTRSARALFALIN